MKKRAFALMLVLVTAFCAVPVAAENPALPAEVETCAELLLSGGETNSRVFCFVLNEAYTDATPDLAITLRYTDFETGEPGEKTVSANEISVSRERFAAEGGTKNRLMAAVSMEVIGHRNFKQAFVAAGSFADQNGGVNEAFTLDVPGMRTGASLKLEYDSRLYRKRSDVSSAPNHTVGEGDMLHVSCETELPVSVYYDGEKLADVAGGEGFSKDLTAEGKGGHRVAVRFLGKDWSAYDFTVDSQLHVYTSTLGSLLQYIGTLMLFPLAAPLVTIIAPPAGIAALAAPLLFLGDGSLEEAVRALFAVFNLLKK